MKITTKTTKEQLKNFLGANVKAVKKMDKDLFDQIAYADKIAKTDDSKVTRKDLMDLARAVMKLLGDKCVEPALAQEAPATPVAENSVKKLTKKKTTKEPVEEEPKEEPKKKVTSKTSTKPKKESVKVKEGTDKPQITPLAEMFPEVLTVGDAEYKIARDIKNMDDLYEAFSKDENIVLAFYWSKRLLKQFGYGDGSLKAPSSFEQDLDVTSCIYVSDEKLVSYHISMYTEALYQVMPDAIEEIDGCRYSNGIEYQIYRAV